MKLKLSYKVKHIIRVSILVTILAAIIIFIYFHLVNDKQLSLPDLSELKIHENEQQDFINEIHEFRKLNQVILLAIAHIFKQEFTQSGVFNTVVPVSDAIVERFVICPQHLYFNFGIYTEGLEEGFKPFKEEFLTKI